MAIAKGRVSRLSDRNIIRKLRGLRARKNIAENGSWLARRKDALAALQALSTVVALLLAFVWFGGQHQTKEQIKIQLAISQRPYEQESHEVLLGVEAWVTNSGKVASYMDIERLWIQSVIPRGRDLYILAKTTSNRVEHDELTTTSPVQTVSRWQQIMAWFSRSTPIGWFRTPEALLWLEPGEMDQAWAGAYRIDDDVKTILVTMDLHTMTGGKWRIARLYDIQLSPIQCSPSVLAGPSKRN